MRSHTSKLVYAPFSPEQVKSMTEYQVFDRAHPFTCKNGHTLQPTEEGLVCDICGYNQDWAHLFMADGSWKNVF